MIGIGIIGLGTVGTGTYRILTEHATLIRRRTGLDLRVVRVAEVDVRKLKGKGLPRGIVTSDAMELIRDERVDIVAELIGGMRPASDFISAALGLGKQVVTANKALLRKKAMSFSSSRRRRGERSGSRHPCAEASRSSGLSATDLSATNSATSWGSSTGQAITSSHG
jgi:homoserine dehydrogenase